MLCEYGKGGYRRLEPIVFISSKSADYKYAETIYHYLMKNNIPVFFSQESLPRIGNSDYRKEIDKNLDNAYHMIVVTSSKENVMSNWVEAEWGFFINEKRSGKKTGNIITVVVGSLQSEDLPPSLRYYEVINWDESNLEKILKYVKTNNTTEAAGKGKQTVAEEYKVKAKEESDLKAIEKSKQKKRKKLYKLQYKKDKKKAKEAEKSAEKLVEKINSDEKEEA
jgi:hypothetical protein